MVLLWTSPDTESIASAITLLYFNRQRVSPTPSWIPDLSRQKEDDVAGYHGRFVTRPTNHKTGWRPPLPIELSEDRNTIKLRGTRFDSIIHQYLPRFQRDRHADEPSTLVVRVTHFFPPACCLDSSHGRYCELAMCRVFPEIYRI